MRSLLTYAALGLFLAMAALGLSGCDEKKPTVKIGASFGVGNAPRWPIELAIMEQRAKELGASFEGRLNKTDTPKTQAEDCRELVDSGINTLILVPRDVNKVDEILAYAKSQKVRVLSYARAVMGESVDLFVGYDTFRIGQLLGERLMERVPEGNLIILKGDENDFNTPLLYFGALKAIKPMVEQGKIRILLDVYVPNWSAAIAREQVKAAVRTHGRVDGILAPNDLFAGAAIEALAELGYTAPVFITGMDADLAALKRLVKGTQDSTIYMDLHGLARTAVDEAYSLANRKKTNSNAEVNNKSAANIDAYLITGKLITRETMDKLLIETGIYTKEEIYEK